MKFRLALAAATMLAAPAISLAQPVTGPYVSLGGGYNVENSQKIKNIFVDGAGTGQWGRIQSKNGYDIDGAIGYGLGNGFRAEVEGDYIHNAFDKGKADGTDYSAIGIEHRYGVFLNGYYDFDIGLPFLYPYVGAGVGWQEDDFHHFGAGGFFTTKTKGTLAYQGIAGLSYPIAAVPGLSATVEYRYVALARSRKFNGSYDGLPATFESESERNNEINVSLRYQLFQPVPPAPAPTPEAAAAPEAPAPVPAKTYLVFFDWDKSDLTPRATDIIAQAASDSKTQNTTTINVSGYTDTSGTPDYNQGLSERRAQAVAAQLVSDGVSQSEIEIHAFGETHLLVPTGPGVREAQNRRVEIVLQ